MKNTLLTLMIALTFSAMADESNTNNSVSLTMESDSVSDFIAELQVAIYQHPTFLAAEASVAQSSQLVNIAKSNRRPQLSLQTSTTNRFSSSFDDKFSFFESSPIKEQTNASLVIRQLLFDSFATSHQIKQQKNTLLADQLVQEQQVFALALKMITNCLDTASYYLLKEMITDSVQRHTEITEQIKVRVDSGRAPMRELTRANARLAEAQAKQLNTELSYESVLAEFRQLMPNTMACKKMIALSTKDLVLDSRTAVDNALAYNLSIQESNMRIKAAEENLMRIKANRWPKVSLKVQGDKYNSEEFLTRQLDDYDFYAGINFDMDLYSGGRKRSEIKGAKEQLNEVRFKKDELVKNITASTESLLSELKNGDKRVEIFKQAFIANDMSRDNLRLQFVSSNVSLLELLQAERDYLESSENMVFNQRSVLLAGFTELALLGKLMNYINKNSKGSSGN
ncbi:MAG: TolC family protein [Gammaproteobacteria bacterium]|jgi:outer membrane protein, adhesin transport system|nr:TolC family protein [Gammaproteobacteria bacterium]